MSYVDSSELRRLTSDIGVVSRGSQRLTRLVVAKGLHDIEADAKAIALAKDVIDTGNLINSISVGIDDDGMGGEVGPTAEYGIYQELGTEDQPARAYLGPAYDRNITGISQALGQIADGLGS